MWTFHSNLSFPLYSATSRRTHETTTEGVAASGSSSLSEGSSTGSGGGSFCSCSGKTCFSRCCELGSLASTSFLDELLQVRLITARRPMAPVQTKAALLLLFAFRFCSECASRCLPTLANV